MAKCVQALDVHSYLMMDINFKIFQSKYFNVIKIFASRNFKIDIHQNVSRAFNILHYNSYLSVQFALLQCLELHILAGHIEAKPRGLPGDHHRVLGEHHKHEVFQRKEVSAVIFVNNLPQNENLNRIL